MKRLAAVSIAVAMAALAALGVAGLGRYRRHRDLSAIDRWAYVRVPEVIGAAGAEAHTLALITEPVEPSPDERARGERPVKVRLVYASGGTTKVISTVCRIVDGRLVSPSDSELRKLDASAQPVEVSK